MFNNKITSKLCLFSALLHLSISVTFPVPANAATLNKIVSQVSGKCVDIIGGPTATRNGINVDQWTCSDSSKNQLFTLQPAGTGVYQLIAEHSKRCLDIPSALTADGIGLQQWDCTAGATKQLFKLNPATSGTTIVSVATGKCVSLHSNSSDNGALIQQYTCNGVANQKFNIVPVNTTPPATTTWVSCAAQYGTCSFSGTRRVLYGVSTTASNVIKTFTNGTACNNTVFGDPAPGQNKSCFYENITQPTTPSGGGTAGICTPSSNTYTQAMPALNISKAVASANLVIRGQNNVVIDGKAFKDEGGQNCLSIQNSTNITVRNSSFIGCYRGVLAENSTNVVIENNYFENNVASAVGLNSTGVKVRYNRIKNAGGGKWLTMSEAFGNRMLPNMVQFNKVYGAGNEITNNVGLNEPGKSSTEDLMTTYQSQGTSSAPIYIQNNCIQGGGPSPSGGGLMVGDQGGKYITARNNSLINVGQYSMAIAGGHYNQILNNRIYAHERSGFPLDVGLYVHDYGNSLDGTGCSNNTVQGNQIDCVHGTNNCGAAKGNECGAVAGWDSNSWGGAFGTPQLGPNLSGMKCPIDFATPNSNNFPGCQ